MIQGMAYSDIHFKRMILDAELRRDCEGMVVKTGRPGKKLV